MSFLMMLESELFKGEITWNYFFGRISSCSQRR